jgi:hypothetical protein
MSDTLPPSCVSSAVRVDDITDLLPFGALYIFGAGEGGRILKSIMDRQPGLSVTGFIDSGRGGELDGVPVIQRDAFFAAAAPGTPVVIAGQAGDQIAVLLRQAGFYRVFDAYPLVLEELEQRRFAEHYRLRIGPPAAPCPVCGNPAPTPLEVPAGWWDWCGDCGDAFRQAKETITVPPEVFAALRADGGRILDISAGPGGVAREMAQRGAHVQVTEYSPVAVDFMRNRLGLPGAVFNYGAGDLTQLFPAAARQGPAPVNPVHKHYEFLFRAEVGG